MSIFASYITRTIPIPFEPGATVTIQKLSGRALELARTAHQRAAMALVRGMGGVRGVAEELANLGPTEAVRATVEQAAAANATDPLRRYDRTVVLEKGITGWSYPEPVNADTIADLSEEAAEWFAREILALTLPTYGDDPKKNT